MLTAFREEEGQNLVIMQEPLVSGCFGSFIMADTTLGTA
jgi:hypothetical protein